MNMSRKKEVLDRYNIHFRKRSDGRKMMNSHENWLSTYFSKFREIGDLNEFIHDVDLALENSFNEIEDLDYTITDATTFYADMEPSGFKVWQSSTEVVTIPYSDLKVILESWKEFLLS